MLECRLRALRENSKSSVLLPMPVGDHDDEEDMPSTNQNGKCMFVEDS